MDIPRRPRRPQTKDDSIRGFEERVDRLAETNPQRNRLIMKAVEMVDESRRVGIEEGLRRCYSLSTGTVIMNNPHVLHSLIAKLDSEFNYQCPHSRFVDDQCERCGEPDPLAADWKPASLIADEES